MTEKVHVIACVSPAWDWKHSFFPTLNSQTQVFDVLDHPAVALSLRSGWFLLMTFRIFGDLLGASGLNSFLTESWYCSKFHVIYVWKKFGHRGANTWKLLAWKKKMAEKAKEVILMSCNFSAWNKSLNSKTKHVNSSEVVKKLEKGNIIQFRIGCSSKDSAQKSPWLVQTKYV